MPVLLHSQRPKEEEESWLEYINRKKIGGMYITHLILIILIFVVAITSFSEPIINWLEFSRSIAAGIIGMLLVTPLIAVECEKID